MKRHAATLLLAISTTVIFAGLAQAADKTAKADKLSKEDRQALAIGRAILKLHELGRAGAPLMTDAQQAELEKNVKFLSGTAANRTAWAWLTFRLRNDGSLTLKENPHAKAIKQRLNLFGKLVSKYFAFE